MVWYVCCSPEWGSPINGTYKFYPPSGGNPAVELGLQEGEIPVAESGLHVLPSGGNPINGAAEPELWEGKSLWHSEWGNPTLQ